MTCACCDCDCGNASANATYDGTYTTEVDGALENGHAEYDLGDAISLDSPRHGNGVGGYPTGVHVKGWTLSDPPENSPTTGSTGDANYRTLYEGLGGHFEWEGPGGSEWEFTYTLIGYNHYTGTLCGYSHICQDTSSGIAWLQDTTNCDDFYLRWTQVSWENKYAANGGAYTPPYTTTRTTAIKYSLKCCKNGVVTDVTNDGHVTWPTNNYTAQYGGAAYRFDTGYATRLDGSVYCPTPPCPPNSYTTSYTRSSQGFPGDGIDEGPGGSGANYYPAGEVRGCLP